MTAENRTRRKPWLRVRSRHRHALSAPSGCDYWAFISYSHKDEAVVRKIHWALETYKIPKKLVGCETTYGSIPSRVYPVFRDRDEFRGAADLKEETANALRKSSCLIVVCSPNAAGSRWVNQEIVAFKMMGREDRVLGLIVDGEPNASLDPAGADYECFPKALVHRVDRAGNITNTRNEPIAADYRTGQDGKFNGKLKILAGILDLRYDELKQRETQRAVRRRIATSILVVVFGFLLFVGYFFAADAGFNVPGGNRIRLALDRRELSVLRRPRTRSEILDHISAERLKYLTILEQRRTNEGGIVTEKGSTDSGWIDVWSYSQTASAVLSTPESTAVEKRRSLSLLAAPFAPQVYVETGGRKYGWIGLEGKQNTQAEPAFWTAIALIAAINQRGLLTENERATALERLKYTEEVLREYCPTEDGGWNLFVDQKLPDKHSTYATSLALLTMLDAKKAGLPWNGTQETRDKLLIGATRWLIKTLDFQASTPGWREAGNGRYEIYDGLTFQVYAELLRAEKEAGISLPPAITQEIPRLLIKYSEHDINAPDESGEFSADIRDPAGQSYNATAADTFLWYPWAITCALRWLERIEQYPVPVEQRIQVERSLDYFVIGVGDQFVKKAESSDWTYNAAESLYVLAGI